ncbi:GNAT family N-acetyltransferase [Microbacterium aurantiacum]|uniref:GNAT family N-acetyltransferase n=1 Tax=Microbacterium aurantiacum TaxID=162393 RepID=A0AAJ2M0M2_9MICO|nr:GNAT family N-acetyltransferase [Microbacterium aurantiacum]MDS0246579.1 GNAT family N-acetyltransferase [Microbacterium aurantiacum]
MIDDSLSRDLHATDVSEASAVRLAARGLELRRVPGTDDGFPAWLQVVARGFLDGSRSPAQIEAVRERSAYRRATGVYDPSAPDPHAPVATLASWRGELSVPGDAAIAACAISSVTVSPTHRRRGIARALLEGELDVARSTGFPVAMLTVSESPLYGRYGFAPAAFGASWRIDARRAGWIGPTPSGRVDFISRERVRELLATVHERIRRAVPGEVDVPGGHWDAIAGTRPDLEKAEQRRAVQYTDDEGEVRGALVYTVQENEADFAASRAHVHYLLAETPDAYAALWRFVLSLDLIAEITADQLSVEEPLRWMIADQRAATVSVRDHQYVRILDVAPCLSSRRYGAPGAVVLEVSDPLGYAEGRWLLRVADDGAAAVTPLAPEDIPADAVGLALGVEELSALFLGGVSATTLAYAGRIRSTDADAAGRIFAWPTAPRLSIWY